MPERTRVAMLSGLGSNTVITGAFSDGSGVCPMLAAHREVGRTRCMSFPEAWDRFTGVHGRYITRAATGDEMLHLRMQLEESINAPRGTNGFAEAIAEHEATVEARRRRSRMESGGLIVDLTSAVEDHRSTARDRRGREATEVGLDWLFEETLVLPEDFEREPAPEPEVAEEFDFSREPVVMPANGRA
ncbi:MAG: hypothetical protein WKF42_07635 [Solirubrobacteraceae bacterium]